MELIKEFWTKNDIEQFQCYLKTLGNENRVEWSKNLLNTQMNVLSMQTVDIKRIVGEIYKGNYLSFLDFMVWEYYENTAINGFLITKIKDFNLMKKYLDQYSSRADNWATCDLLAFNIKDNEIKYYNLTLEYIKSDKPFVRRIGMLILFNYIDKDEYIYKIYEILNQFEEEKHYYVNMMNAWLLCECFIKQREKTLKYLEKNKLNKFTLNKGIQKCRESRRVSNEDKQMLLNYKIK